MSSTHDSHTDPQPSRPNTPHLRPLLLLGSLLNPEHYQRTKAKLADAMARPWWLPFQVHHPEGESGNVRLVRQTISEEDALLWNLQQTQDWYRGTRSYPGTWTFLLLDDEVWMSDTPMEIVDHLPFIQSAEGNVLITGLGLGVVVQALLQKPTVTRIDVIEKNPDVARLVTPSFAGDPRFHLHLADAWDWTPPPGLTYDWAWHDIWRDLDPRNLPEYDRLKRRFKEVAHHQEYWAEDFLASLAGIHEALESAVGEANRATRALNEKRYRSPFQILGLDEAPARSASEEGA